MLAAGGWFTGVVHFDVIASGTEPRGKVNVVHFAPGPPPGTATPAALVLDEVGYLPLSRAEANVHFLLVACRYERGFIVLISNKAFSEWGAITGDEVLATAILDRLLHHCDVLSINGPCYRLQDVFLTPPEPPMP